MSATVDRLTSSAVLHMVGIGFREKGFPIGEMISLKSHREVCFEFKSDENCFKHFIVREIDFNRIASVKNCSCLVD